jgi:hypothetical protein
MSEQTGQNIEVSDAPEQAPPKYSRFHAFAQHGEHAQRAYNSLSDLPESFQHEFLKTLDENPSLNVEDLASRVRAKAEGRAMPEPDEGEKKPAKPTEAAEAKSTEDEPKKELLLSPNPTAPDKTNEQVSALEAKVGELGSKIDDLEKSAKVAASGVQLRLVAIETELDRLRGERGNPAEQSSPARRVQNSETLPTKREMVVNLVAALVFVASIVVAAAYVNQWPAGVW